MQGVPAHHPSALLNPPPAAEPLWPAEKAGAPFFDQTVAEPHDAETTDPHLVVGVVGSPSGGFGGIIAPRSCTCPGGRRRGPRGPKRHR